MKRFFAVLCIITELISNNTEVRHLKAVESDISFSIATGKTSSLLVTTKGNVYAWGLWGENNDINNSKRYSKLTDISDSFPLNETDKIISVSSGEQHSVFLSEKGKVFAFGSNESKQLLYDDYGKFVVKPKDLSDEFNLEQDEKIVKISCGSNFSLALSNKNKLYPFGNNEYGQLGNNGLDERRIIDITKNITLQDGDYIKDIACGGTHALILTNNGHVYGMGNNSNYQLGTIKDEKTSTYKDNKVLTPCKLFTGIENIIAIACGKISSYILTDKHQLYAVGTNSHGQIADKKSITSSGNDYIEPYNMTNNFNLQSEEYISNIYAGYYFCIVKTNENNYFSFGENSNGQLGINTDISTSVPTKTDLSFDDDEMTTFSLAENHCLACSKKGKAFTWGSNSYGQLSQEIGISTNQLVKYDITNLLPPIVELSMFTSTTYAKSYIVDIKAYYLDGSKIKSIFYAINSSEKNNDSWQILNTSKLIIDSGEGKVYLHLKINSDKEEYIYNSGPFFLDHTNPSIDLYVNNQIFDGKYINMDVNVVASDNVEGVKIKYYKDDVFHQEKSTLLLKEDGVYRVYSEDVAGNVSSEIMFVIDKSFPSILSINNNKLSATSFTTNEKIATIESNEKLACYSIKYPNQKESTLIGLNNDEKEFTFNLKKGENIITVYDLAGNESSIYSITYSPRFFQDGPLMLLVFGSITLGFVLIVLITYLIRNKEKFFK